MFYAILSIEICAISKISKKEIGRCFKLILRALETSVDLITSGDFMVSLFEIYIQQQLNFMLYSKATV